MQSVTQSWRTNQEILQPVVEKHTIFDEQSQKNPVNHRYILKKNYLSVYNRKKLKTPISSYHLQKKPQNFTKIQRKKKKTLEENVEFIDQ